MVTGSVLHAVVEFVAGEDLMRIKNNFPTLVYSAVLSVSNNVSYLNDWFLHIAYAQVS